MNAVIYRAIEAHQLNQFVSFIEQRRNTSPSSLPNLVSSLITELSGTPCVITQHSCAEFTVAPGSMNHLLLWCHLQMDGLNSECDGKVWRVDVGMSSGVLNAEAQV